MNHPLITATLLATLCAPAWAVNKCTGADGKISYQDASCDGGSATGRDDLANARKDAQRKSAAVVQSRKSVAADLEAQLEAQIKRKADLTPQRVETAPTTTVSSSSKAMPFDQCNATVKSTIQTLAVNWKDFRRIVNSAEMTMTKICTRDGSVTITCSAPDSRMVTTQGAQCGS